MYPGVISSFKVLLITAKTCFFTDSYMSPIDDGDIYISQRNLNKRRRASFLVCSGSSWRRPCRADQRAHSQQAGGTDK